MIRRYGEAIKAGQNYRKRPGVYGVLLDGQAVLLTHQAEPIPEYQLPGGGIDAGEMQKRLTEKVEELTLYILDLQNQVNELKKQR